MKRVEVVDKRGIYIYLGAGWVRGLLMTRTIGILWGCVNVDFHQIKAPHLHRQRPSKPNNSPVSGSCSRKLSVKNGRSHGNMQVDSIVTNISDTCIQSGDLVSNYRLVSVRDSAG